MLVKNVKLLELNKSSEGAGIIYTEEEVIKTLESQNSIILCTNEPSEDGVLLSDVEAVVENTNIENNILSGDVNFITNNQELFNQLKENKVRLALNAQGRANDKNEVFDLTIIGFNFVYVDSNKEE